VVLVAGQCFGPWHGGCQQLFFSCLGFGPSGAGCVLGLFIQVTLLLLSVFLVAVKCLGSVVVVCSDCLSRFLVGCEQCFGLCALLLIAYPGFMLVVARSRFWFLGSACS
jgi:hypothetical protein